MRGAGVVTGMTSNIDTRRPLQTRQALLVADLFAPHVQHLDASRADEIVPAADRSRTSRLVDVRPAVPQPLAPATVKSFRVGHVAHAVVRVQDIALGDICFVIAPGWLKSPSHHLISTVQRLRMGSVWPLPDIHAAGPSVNVVHAAIVVDVNATLGELTFAESTPPGGLRETVHHWHEPAQPDSGIDARCKYLFYRMRCPTDAGDIARLAHGWVSSKAGYASAGAALAALMPNSPHHFSRRDLVQLAQLINASTMPACPTNAMICSQFVARVWGAIAAARNDDRVSHATGARRSQRRAVAVGFPCSTLNVLPARLHAAMSVHSDFAPVGMLYTKGVMPIKNNEA